MLACLWVIKNFLEKGPKKKEKIKALVRDFNGNGVELIKACLESSDFTIFTPAARCICDITDGHNADIEVVVNEKLIKVFKIFYFNLFRDC